MRHTNRSVQVGGSWFAIASALMVVVLALHGPLAPDLAEQMRRVSGMATTWSIAHWIAAAALSLYAVAGLIMLTSHSQLTDAWWTTTAWAVIPIAALWTLTTAIAEATVVANAARTGNREVFDAWWAFAEGKAAGFSFLALAVAVIARNDARSAERVTPPLSAWVAMVAGILSFTGWALGMWFGIPVGNLLWLVATVVMSVWAAWFGIALARSPATARQP